VFRGFFLQGLARKAGIIVAIIASSILWGVGHLVSMAKSNLPRSERLMGIIAFTFWGIALS
jgi:membrane protease YdiL (CAAX protease family)